MKPYERYIKFVNNVTITFSDDQMTKIKVVHLDEFYNFHVHDFFRWNHLVFQNIVWICHFLKFKIWIVQIESHEKMIKIKVVYLDELYNFYVHNFSRSATFILFIYSSDIVVATLFTNVIYPSYSLWNYKRDM